MKTFFFLLASMLLMTGSTVRAKDQEKDRDRIRKQDRIHQEDHLMLQDGSCLLVQQGVQTKLQQSYKLKNGTVVNPDGSYQLQNQQKYQLRNGECMDMDGNRYRNLNRFNKRVSMTNKQIERVRTNAMKNNRPGNETSARKGNKN